jgi:hypothetical protein
MHDDFEHKGHFVHVEVTEGRGTWSGGTPSERRVYGPTKTGHSQAQTSR